MSDDRNAELPTERQDDDDAPPDVFVLTVVEGPDAGATITVDPASPARVLLGKSVTATFRLRDSEVSRRHASLRPDARALVLSDLGSTNGTHVNGVSVREAALRGGEAIAVGKTVIAVSRNAPSFVTLTNDEAFGRMLGASATMRRLYPVLHRLSAADRAVLLEGEAGVGKALCAEEMHARSARARSPFAVLKCHTLATQAIEPRLFGPEGLVEEADGGSVYVDEVSALPTSLQRRLSSFLERPGPVRFFFGTRRDLDRDVADGAFREALLVALAPGRVELPPLRERDRDVELLARAFWGALVASEASGGADKEALAASPSTAPEAEPAELPADFLARFQRYRWPGNVRELSGAVCARFDMGALGRWRVPAPHGGEADFLGAVVDRELPLADARQLVVDQLERRYVDHMLARHGNTRDAAQASGVGVRYFQLLRARLEI